MALSNIFREPRRELTESAVGIVPLAIWLYVDYHLSLQMQAIAGRAEMPWQAAMVLLTIALGVAIFFLVLVAIATHSLGEAVCDALQERGIHLRPRWRR